MRQRTLLQKYLLRKDLVQRTVTKLRRVRRKWLRNPFRDQQRLLSAAGVEVETVFDVGANQGDITQKYLELFPRATVHSFEPLPEATPILTRRFAGNPRVVINSVAVADSVGPVHFFPSSTPNMSSLFPPATPDTLGFGAAPQPVEIPCITLDSYCRERGVERVNVLKMDIQGGELRALQGAAELLAGGRIDLIYTEAPVLATYQDQSLMHQLTSHVQPYGYSLFNFYGLRVTEFGQAIQFDVVYVSQRVRETLAQKGLYP